MSREQPSSVVVLLRRTRGRSPGFLIHKCASAIRSRCRTALASLGRNPYRHRPGAGGAPTLAATLAALDRSLITAPDEAKRLGRLLARQDSPALNDKVERLLAGRVSLLGCECAVGPGVDWCADPEVGLRWPEDWHARIDYLDTGRPTDVKHAWELSRLQFLTDLGRAYVRSGDERLARACVAIIEDWDENNAVGRTVNWTCAMECCLRAVTLIWCRTFFADSPSMADDFWGRTLRMLVEHGRFVWRNLEYSDVCGNHYTSNLLGLLYLALALPWYGESPRWRRAALRGLRQEVVRQTYADGVVHEGSIPYDRLVTEMFLHAGLLCRRHGIDLGATYWQRLERMVEFVAGYLKPDGAAPLYGDADDGRILPLGDQRTNDHRYLVALGAVLFERPDMKRVAGQWWEEAAWLTGTSGAEAWEGLEEGDTPASAGFREGGFYFLRCGDTYAAVDCGDIGLRGRGGHGHNDMLSACVCLRGRDIIVDTGCHSYSSSREVRLRSISARAHNASVVDDAEPAEIELWYIPHATACACEALAWEPDARGGRFTGRHTGYVDRFGVVCARTVEVQGRDEVLIVDRLEGRGSHRVDWRWLLAPGLSATSADGGARLETDTGEGYAFEWSAPELRLDVEHSEHYPTYGVTVPALCLHVWGTVELPFEATFALRSET